MEVENVSPPFRVEEQYFTPLSAKAQDFGERNPIIFVSECFALSFLGVVKADNIGPLDDQTFLVVFTLLSSVPILFAL